ncbi:MAG: mandelate racemase/muconate lactonizing enzyme family protein, partial [Chloroflexota bacterium]
MKITEIKTFCVPMGIKNMVIVKIETDAGLYGLGEGGLSTRDLAIKGAVEHYRQWLIGRDPMRTGALWQEMYRSQYFEGGRALTSAISAIDMALYDIKGKALGVPVYELLGGRHRDYVDTFASTSGHSADELVTNARRLLGQGWRAIRTFPTHPPSDDPNLFEPRESIPLTAEWLTRLRAEVGLGPALGIDYHHRLSVAETASFCQRMPTGTLDFLEEPIRDECPEAYQALRQMTDVPLAIGEEFSSKWQALPYIERGLTNFMRLDICHLGGLTESLKVAGWCEAHYIDLMPHNPLGPVCAAGIIHLAAAVPNFAWMEVFVGPEGKQQLDWELFPVQSVLDGARFPVPTAPGLGVEMNEEVAASRPFRFSEFPHYHRRDGSH